MPQKTGKTRADGALTNFHSSKKWNVPSVPGFPRFSKSPVSSGTKPYRQWDKENSFILSPGDKI